MNTKDDGETTPFVTAEIVEETLDYNHIAYNDFLLTNLGFAKSVEECVKWNLIAQRNSCMKSTPIQSLCYVKNYYEQKPSGSWARNQIAFAVLISNILENKIPEWFPNGEMDIFRKIDLDLEYCEQNGQYYTIMWLFTRDSHCTRCWNFLTRPFN